MTMSVSMADKNHQGISINYRKKGHIIDIGFEEAMLNSLRVNKYIKTI